MTKLQKIEIKTRYEGKEIKVFLRKNLPHLTLVENRKHDNFLTPADPGLQGLWEKSCTPVNLFPDVPDYREDYDDHSVYYLWYAFVELRSVFDE